MAISDHLEAANTKVELNDAKNALRELEDKKREKESEEFHTWNNERYVTFTFLQAASMPEELEKKIAYALASGEPLRIQFMRSCSFKDRPLMFIGESVAGPKTYQVTSEDITSNEAYKSFKDVLANEGIEVTELDVLTEYGWNRWSAAHLTLKMEN